MKLFDEIPRPNDDCPRHAEPEFEYMNRSGRHGFVIVRGQLEDWFSRYPAEDQADLRSRFRSNKDGQHWGAYFELLLHEMLLRLDCHVEIHPEINPDVSTRPDFFVSPPLGEPFCLEAVHVPGESQADAGAVKRFDSFLDQLNQLLDSPDFIVFTEIRAYPESQPSATKVARFLTNRLASLDFEEETDLRRSGHSRDHLGWEYSDKSGLDVVFRARLKRPEARGGKGARPAGSRFRPCRLVDNTKPMRNAIIEKAKKYGEIGIPYVVAVHASGRRIDDINVMEALFGKERYGYHIDETGLEPMGMTRAPNGVWTGGSGRGNLNAVLVFRKLNSSWSLGEAEVCLVYGPQSEEVFPVLSPFPQLMLEDEGPDLRLYEGKSLAEILGLPEGWPDGGQSD